MQQEISIEQIRPNLTWRLRNEVLYPAEPLNAMPMTEDDNGLHFGAFYQNQLVGVVSLFERDSDFQFRKFAVTPAMQGKGIGNALLQHLINFATTNGAKRIWCNARTTAINFYLKAGFETTGHPFSKNGFDYEIMEKLLA